MFWRKQNQIILTNFPQFSSHYTMILKTLKSFMLHAHRRHIGH